MRSAPMRCGSPGAEGLAATATGVEYQGDRVAVTARTGLDEEIVALVPEAEFFAHPITPGAALGLSWPPRQPASAGRLSRAGPTEPTKPTGNRELLMSKMRYSRRALLKSGAAAMAASALPAPMIWAQEIKDITLRQFGTGVSNLNEVAQKVKEDLGFTLEMTALDSDSVTQRAATQPDSFDIADIEYWICKKVWPTGNLQAMDTSKIAN